MSDHLEAQIAALGKLSVKDLRRRFAELTGDDVKTWNRTWLIRRLAWRMQSLALGGLSERARQRAAELANDADLRLTPPPLHKAPVLDAPTPPARDPRLPKPGTVLTRRYKGVELRVHVLEDGFRYDGQLYSSLSAVAKAITGSHCNGFQFFELTKAEKNQ